MLLGKNKDLKKLQERWLEDWEDALAAWSRFTKLTEPRWCLTKKEEKQEQLTDSFAMIRLLDHAVVIGLRQVKEQGLEGFAKEILAHEIGHHVYAPGDLRDNARLQARVRAGLPGRENMAGILANMYTDLLINDRLQRGAGLNMAGVYKKLKSAAVDRIWSLYMRIYEVLWRLPAGTLVPEIKDKQIQTDAALGARLIRAYAKDWLDGAGRFAALFLPYLLENKNNDFLKSLATLLDTQRAGEGGEVPDGLTAIDDGEEEGAIHPAYDPELTGLDRVGEEEPKESSPQAGKGREKIGGKKNKYRTPSQYKELMKSVGVKLSEEDLVIRYYRERARPNLVKFPTRKVKESTDPLPEGLDTWEPGTPLSRVDWMESVIRSPYIIPGVTTMERTYGTSPGHNPERQPVDLFLGVDCSGSMINPKLNESYPVLAGAIIVLSALRTGARVKVTLSGEPGEHSSTDGFIRNEHDILKVLTGYLGTGYAFGVLRLRDTFLTGDKLPRPVHILLVTDSDLFMMLGETKNGWGIAREALEKAGGGGTCVLNIPYDSSYFGTQISRLKDDGWDVHLVSSWEELVAFARAFSKTHYEKD